MAKRRKGSRSRRSSGSRSRKSKRSVGSGGSKKLSSEETWVVFGAVVVWLVLMWVMFFQGSFLV